MARPGWAARAVILLVPADAIHPARPDEHFADEAVLRVRAKGTAVYRGATGRGPSGPRPC